MIKSMTGYGQYHHESDSYSIKVEVKSLNSKFLDLSLKYPKSISDKEFEIRNITSKVLERGKVHLSIDTQFKGESKRKVHINKELAKTYYKAIYDTAVYLGAPEHDVFRMTMQMPDVIASDTSPEADEQEWKETEKAIGEALKACEGFRKREGDTIRKSMLDYVDKIKEGLESVKKLDPTRIERVRLRIRTNLDKSEQQIGELDQNRFEQELIYYIEKLDISEEVVRLQEHLNYFVKTVEIPEPSGKKLGFISQEIGREINTIGSKAVDVDMQKQVVIMKDELEKIKEQLGNVL